MDEGPGDPKYVRAKLFANVLRRQEFVGRCVEWAAGALLQREYHKVRHILIGYNGERCAAIPGDQASTQQPAENMRHVAAQQHRGPQPADREVRVLPLELVEERFDVVLARRIPKVGLTNARRVLGDRSRMSGKRAVGKHRGEVNDGIYPRGSGSTEYVLAPVDVYRLKECRRYIGGD